MNTQISGQVVTRQRRNTYWRLALLWLGVIWLGLGFSACRQPPPTPFFPEGEAISPSRPQTGKTAAFSVRLLERIEKSPGVSNTGPLHYGHAIALNGEFMAVGAPESSGMQGHQKGIVFLYQHEGAQWVETAALTASDEEVGFQDDLEFGRALALDGDTLAVGAPEARAPQAGGDTGVVYIFERRGNTWEEVGILYASDPRTGARFGEKVLLRDEVLLVQGGQTVYVFERVGENWVEQAHLTGEDLGERDRFGHNMALDGDLLAVGSVEYNSQLERYSSSVVYVYRRDNGGWTLEARLVPAGNEELGFVISLALEGETLAVGGSDDAAGYLAGAVYIYENGPEGWAQQAKLVPADASFAFFTSFGSALALQGDLLIVGAAADSSQGLWSGSVYLFHRQDDTWVDLLKLWPAETDYLGAFFGSAVELSGNIMLVAAPAEFGNAVYVYEINPEVN